MVVYGDILILENSIIGAALLVMTCMVCRPAGGSFKGGVAKVRLAVGGFMCGIFALTIFIPSGPLLRILMEMVFAPAVCLVSFGRKRLLQRAVVFFLVTYFTGGITMGLLLLTKNNGYYCGAGIYTGDMKAAILALFMGIVFVTLRQVTRTVAERKLYAEHTFEVTIAIGDAREKAQGFLDTGNHLREPASGKPVAVAEKSLWARLEKSLVPERLCIVPFTFVKGRGLMEGVRTDYVEVGGRRIKGCVIAKGEGELFPEKEGFELLLSNNMNEGGL
ncbi:MAG: hypothetical protein GX663_03175 [Clostridiales bacterium]|nr:hypothetical protein [Clostridiales bacterium]